MIAWPRHLENIKPGICANCRILALLRWHFGPLQERKLCDVCGEGAWLKLCAETGRLEEWLRLTRNYP